MTGCRTGAGMRVLDEMGCSVAGTDNLIQLAVNGFAPVPAIAQAGTV